MAVNVDVPAVSVTTEFETSRELKLVELVTVIVSFTLFVNIATSAVDGKPPVPPLQVAVTLETGPAEQVTLVNPTGSIPVNTFVCQAVVLFQDALPFVQVRVTAAPRDAAANNPRAMTAATRAEVNFRDIQVRGCD